MPRKRKRLDGAIRARHASIDHPRRVKALHLQIVHGIVRVIRRLMALGAGRFAEEEVLPALFRRGGFLRVHLAVNPQLGCRREIQEFLELRHEMHLAPPFENVGPFFCPDHMIAVEVGPPLLKLREILHALERPLRAEEPLDVEAAQRRGINAMTELLRADVSGQMGTGVRMAVRMTLEAGNATAGTHAAPVFCLIELLLREWGDEQPQPLELFRIQNPVKQFIIVVEGHQFALGYVTQIGPGCQVDGGGNSGKKWAGRSKSRSKRVRSRPSCF